MKRTEAEAAAAAEQAAHAATTARQQVARMTDTELEEIVDGYEGEASTIEADLVEAAERELDAREQWNSDDDRVREAAGNYQPNR